MSVSLTARRAANPERRVYQWMTARRPFEPYISNPAYAFWSQAAFLLPLVAWDLYSRGKLHPATIFGAVLLVSEGPLRDVLSHTQAWIAFARWSTDLLA